MDLPQLIISGSVAIDRIMHFDGLYKEHILPEKVHTLSLSIFIDSLRDTDGGIGANIAYSLALLGEKPVLLGSLGKRDFAYKERLTELGVDTTHLYLSDLPTASFTVMTDRDDNQIGGFYPGAMFDSSTLSLKPWFEDDVLVVVSAHDPKMMKQQVRECKEQNLRLFYDIGQQVTNTPVEDLKEGLAQAELLIVNEYELDVLSSKVSLRKEEIKKRIPVLVTTFGKLGSVIEGAKVKDLIQIPIAKPREFTDPTGAGDGFRAGFLYGYIRNWNLEVCGKLGSVAASFTVEKLGTQEHKFTREEFEARFKENFGEEISLDNYEQRL
ncbi:hypothetical protein A2631_03145 [Candidatus Daviesbacteria bacterium RIFCSPHIGHO2_01_FULL_44_29]|uniref:Carbohydrate kinase PfkB domain-containing protein n=1 Tax=Candidatus Daviesbacteria bacterium RIFCSPHIGHO2_02_FULL_43_12 TaxID=1797776 RepID=A0A1F5KKP0_9BACT|nr:MAG: hypothetical protein A2631_03145 [Candidatus Daviesbacteria bacterium RIFCSPHIGHO2_01_FULL_44_29]OGE40769.1 MAG: hypothetical protein A3E86_02200 [Candidatus Daviesbacteria bacterium RIFCSPHIGHO2_12_FULL_47_45]OGE41380.1 MAG: hypothetical protein A3D25_02540 [Candidatus Daviesbacteria bacterium RIFCSPHIGHO2_02_FULL_43_12]OGE69581.1 MAG: hypothetical protein A3B55_04285 [Candidatus Daviesbacteria bacterium RIFCSPLOWO2_01_FULL_43_15]